MTLVSPVIGFRRQSRCLYSAARFWQQLSNTATHLQRRWFLNSLKSCQAEEIDAHSSTDASSRPDLLRPQCWTILSKSSLAVVSVTGLATIRTRRIQQGKTPLVILLVTPSHIELLKNDGALIPKIFCQAFHSHEVGQEFHVLAAVVDRVPYVTLDELESNSFHKSRKRHGDEGISVCILDSEIAAPDLWTARDQPRHRETMSLQQQSTISFLLQTSPENTEAQINNVPPQSVVSRLMQLPVANTLFRNGRTSTVLAQRWAVTNDQTSKPELRLTEENALSQQLLRLTEVTSDYSHNNGYVMSAPQTPITPPRIVTAAMGNIIRTIQMGDSPENYMPASTELENAVARVRQNSELLGEIAGIWALVTPRENRVSQPHVRPRQTLRYAIDSGSRLHKVLSGGGGWGNKQGLLALDPDSEYSMDREASQELFGDGEDIEAEKIGALGEVVKPGDLVSFWAHISPVAGKKSEPDKTPAKSAKVTIPRSVQFGTIPSTMDLMPGSDASDLEDTTAPLYTLIINHFGMLSEGGMSMRVSKIGPEDKSALGAEQVGVVVQTKIDTPYSRISILERGKQSFQYLPNELPGASDKRKAVKIPSVEKTRMSQIEDREISAAAIKDSAIKYERGSKPPKRTFRRVGVDFKRPAKVHKGQDTVDPLHIRV